MSFGEDFPFTWEEEMDFISKCQKSVKISHIKPSNAIPAYKLSEELPNNDENDSKKQDRIIIGLHPPSTPIIPFTFKQIITKTKTITLNKNITNKNNIQISEPPLKKPKLCDWRTGNNKPIDSDSNSNNNNNMTKLCKSVSNSKSKNKNDTEIKIPKGCEILFTEDGQLVEELSDLDIKLVQTIGFELLSNCDSLSWDDIAGLQLEKNKIQEAVIWPLSRADLFDNDSLRKKPKGVLLFGPPGTGKTMIAKTIASEAKATFFSISPSSLQSKYIGESAKLVRAMFSVARYMAPSIVFIDECESLLGKRSADSTASSNASNSLKTQFLQELQGVKSKNNDGYVLIIGATNFPELIDEAVRRRLSKRLYIPLPDKNGRKQLLLNLLKKANHILNNEQIDILVEKMKGYSGSDITCVAEEAAFGPLRDAGSFQTVDKNELRPLEFKDFELALKHSKSSVKEDEIDKYNDWNEQFGCNLMQN
eukprot:337028_1